MSSTWHRYRPELESLENRLAPATLVDARTVTYRDLDGDDVRVRFSQAVLTPANVDEVLNFQSGVTGEQLRSINLLDGGVTPIGARGLSVRVIAEPQPFFGGDGLANVGQIIGRNWATNAGFDLGDVRVDGDLGWFQAGNANTATRGAKSLTVHSLGRYGLTTGAARLDGEVNGRLGRLTVWTDVVGASLTVAGGLGPVHIGGSLVGLSEVYNGRISSAGNMGDVHIGGSINAGAVVSGSLAAGSAGRIERVFVGGSIQGGAWDRAGSITTLGPCPRIRVLGDLSGGAGSSSGSIVAGNLPRVTVDGSVTAGTGVLAGSIIARGKIGTLVIGGDLAGNLLRPAVILASGQAVPSPGVDVAIGSLSVGGNVIRADIGAGWTVFPLPIPINADAQIGRVSVGGDWIASSLSAGAVPGPLGYGTLEDEPIGPTPGLVVRDSARTISRIARIVIGGTVQGTVPFLGDRFGFVAQHIRALSIGGLAISLEPGRSNDFLPLGGVDDVHLHEI